ncbi:protein kinase [Sorangium sp. So ce1014]|uniref:protein kinase n=1 Tax=Sorangium sp. So ce1014 TaxID=3133326 RepID=UPI003F5FE806
MVAAGEIWEGHELLNEERGLVRHFLARQGGDKGDLVWLHVHEGTGLDEGAFAEEIARLQRLSDEVPEVVRVLYGGVRGSVAWAATPVLSDAVPLLDAARGYDLGPAALQELIAIGRCLERAHELSMIHGALSPDRVFVVGDGRYAITHFGFVRLFQLGSDDARQDPYGYLPPELFSGGRLGLRADVYGFGTIMYELLCKRPLSTWIEPTSFPVGLPRELRGMMTDSLAENPERRQPSIRTMLAVLTPFAREWGELGEPPAAPNVDIFAEPSGARCKPDEGAPISVEDEAEPLGSGEQVGRASALPTPRPSEAPDTARSAPPRDAQDHAPHAPPLAASRPPDTPDTLKSAVPPRDARDHTIYAPTVVPPAPPAPELPDLAPRLPVQPTPSTPPPSPLLSVAPAPSPPLRSSGTPGRRSPTRRLSALLALAFLLGSAGALVLRREQSPPRAAPRLARVVQRAALRATPPPPPRPSDAPRAPPPVAHRSVTNRQAAFPRQAMKTPSKDGDDGDVCNRLVVCGPHKY